MSGRITTRAINSKIFFSNPLKQYQYPVLPPSKVPDHIIRPPYMIDQFPKYGVYEGSPLKHSPQEIVKLKRAAKVASNSLAATQKFIKQSYRLKKQITQEDIDQFVFDSIISQGAYPTPIGFMNFPKSVCVSVNECIVHGIPTTRTIQQGDKINIDITAYIDGYHGDNNLTVTYGPSKHQQINNIIVLAQKALYEAISICKPGTPFKNIGLTLQNFAKRHQLYICDEFSGHGIGKLLHMPPMVFHRYYPIFNDIMEVGNAFTIEPIFTLFPITKLELWQDQFTTISPNNPNAQFEHTILITQNGCQVITKRQDQIIPGF